VFTYNLQVAMCNRKKLLEASDTIPEAQNFHILMSLVWLTIYTMSLVFQTLCELFKNTIMYHGSGTEIACFSEILIEHTPKLTPTTSNETLKVYFE